MLQVIKRDYEVVTFESSPSSMTRFARWLVNGLADIDDPDLFGQEDLDDFFTAVDRFREQIDSSPAASVDEESVADQ